MSELPPPPPGTGTEADRDVADVLGMLTQRGSRGLTATIGALHRTIELICVAAGLTGAAALVLGLWAWHHALPGWGIAVLAGAPTMAISIYVLVRTSALAKAVKHPAETLAQAQDLVLRAKGSPELHKLAGGIRTAKAAKRAGVGRTRRALRTGRLISSVIGLAAPDPVRHELLIPFQPARLKGLWLAITIGLWAWLVSAIMAWFAVVTLLLQGVS